MRATLLDSSPTLYVLFYPESDQPWDQPDFDAVCNALFDRTNSASLLYVTHSAKDVVLPDLNVRRRSNNASWVQLTTTGGVGHVGFVNAVDNAAAETLIRHGMNGRL